MKRTVRDIFPYKNPFLPKNGNPNDRLIGVELEIENNTMSRDLINIIFEQLVVIHEDNSLKDKGVELVTVPLNENQQKRFYECLVLMYESQSKLKYSHRCSIHVHVDARDLPVDNIATAVAAYLCVSQLFFNKVAPYRQSSNFCAPLVDSSLTKEWLHDSHYQTEDFKYFDLNLYTLRKYNTLEFRHMEGHKDVERLKEWVCICRDFVTWCVNMDPDKVAKAIKKLNTVSNYSEFIRDIWGDNIFEYFRGMDLVKDMSPNVSVAKGLL